MDNNYSIFIEKHLDASIEDVAKRICDSFITEVTEHNGRWNHLTRGGYASYFKRRAVGATKFFIGHPQIPEGYTFRRISTHKREFAFHKLEHLLNKKTLQPLILKGCRCPRCVSDIKVTWKEKPELELYYSK